ncbi:DEAD/DEAH box helicase family protein [Endozoicomonas euniceicola]|uniref:DEAD/DEAH box helicase family protein n=1 Tax=Endozoicomonas euniceicola TaxID=1234143 RepID=A0ABY6GTK8_9GAMM|nr:DEAD/DEAH box helicase family protein [Endozoicomonas euniceicola]UYM15902.1 DEAD/DEAH box helicase family protein [Endozoicomonas euniceicola]
MLNCYLTALDASSEHWAEEVDKSFEPFRRYLKNAEEALRKKEVTCEWERLPVPGVLQLCQPLYQVHPTTRIELIPENEGWYEVTGSPDGVDLIKEFEPDFEELVTVGRGADRQKIKVSEQQYNHTGDQILLKLNASAIVNRIVWCGDILDIKPLTQELTDNLELTQELTTYQAKRESENCYRIQGVIDASLPLFFQQQDVKFRVLSEPSLPDNIIRHGSDLFMVGEKKEHSSVQFRKVTDKAFLKDCFVSDLCTEDGYQLPDEWYLDEQNRLVTGDDPLPDFLTHRHYPGLRISVRSISDSEPWIQLIGLDHGEETASQDPLEYFFDDQIDIYDPAIKGKNTQFYCVKNARPDERQIILGRGKDKKKAAPLYPKGKQLKVRVNTLALKRQKDAITRLKMTPAREHKPLLDLIRNRDSYNWPLFNPVSEKEIDWSVLTNMDFDGCDRQREFVCKALATPDFAILDGPPGTGKTTTILELIVQLIKQGKRVLLTASTHAAINNVLERIDELDCKQGIYPLRIGDENRATGVEHHQYDRVLDSFSENLGHLDCKRLLVDSSNLVCGTTMGILRLLGDTKFDFERGIPPFDVMIIDECSKTTFAEFLVPARYAKSWILVGDVKQLSPFTERDQITANLKHLVLRPAFNKQKEQILSAELQRACFLLNELKTYQKGRWGYHERIIVPVSSGELRAIAAEIEARHSERDGHIYSDIGLVGHAVGAINEKSLRSSPWNVYQYNLIFCEERLLSDYRDYLPADSIVFGENWCNSAHAYRHFARHDGEHNFKIKRSDIMRYSHEIHEQWCDHEQKSSWADEVVWRLEREYWLRFLTPGKRTRRRGNKNNKAKAMKDQLERLMPRSISATGRVYQLRNMAFPSILEALSGSGTLKTRAENPNTLNQGFNFKEKQCRHTTLTYQHRMHPDISCFPREQFYSDHSGTQSLLDGRFTESDRFWEWRRYPKRAVWADVEGKVYKNSNVAEVNTILSGLKDFCSWANQQGVVGDHSVAILTFYRKQESLLRSKLQDLTREKRHARFTYKGVNIKLNTVDFFQGQEADLVYLSMVNTNRDGFLDSPNRLNVSLTRARYQLVVVGKKDYFANNSPSAELSSLARSLMPAL